jgi:salicylate hydroxylase
MALEDAWVLAAALDRLPQAEALAAYETARKPRVTRIVEAATANARNYHLANPLVRGVAHTVLRLGGALAPEQALRRFDWLYGHDVTRDK